MCFSIPYRRIASLVSSSMSPWPTNSAFILLSFCRARAILFTKSKGAFCKVILPTKPITKSSSVNPNSLRRLLNSRWGLNFVRLMPFSMTIECFNPKVFCPVIRLLSETQITSLLNLHIIFSLHARRRLMKNDWSWWKLHPWTVYTMGMCSFRAIKATLDAARLPWAWISCMFSLRISSLICRVMRTSNGWEVLTTWHLTPLCVSASIICPPVNDRTMGLTRLSNPAMRSRRWDSPPPTWPCLITSNTLIAMLGMYKFFVNSF